MSKAKHIFITGASSGIGEATAKRLVNGGHKVALIARSQEKLTKLQQELGEDNAIVIVGDATEKAFMRHAVSQANDEFGSIDVVFANAGMGLDNPGVLDGDMEEWDKMIAVNINALLYTAHITMPYLKSSRGHFISTSSVAGRVTLKGSVYGASKWFAYGFTMNLAEEMAEWGGRCTTISPGMVNTRFFSEPKPDKLDPDDVAKAVEFAIEADPGCSVREVCVMPVN